MEYNTNEEVWVPVKDKGYEDFYEVSDKGRIRSVDRIVESKRGNLNYKGRLIITPNSDDGYPIFNFCKSGKKKSVRVHQVVAKAFIPNPKGYVELNHKDEVKHNNHVDNLEWCTRKYNMNYGTVKERVESHPNQIKRHEESKKSVVAININTQKELHFESISEANRNGFKRRNIWSAINGDDASHNGYVWIYGEEYDSELIKSKINRTKVNLVAHIDDNGNTIRILGTVEEASEIIGVGNGTISRVCNGIYKQTKGYKLKYI